MLPIQKQALRGRPALLGLVSYFTSGSRKNSSVLKMFRSVSYRLSPYGLSL